LADVSEVLTASRAIIALMMEAASTSETSANFYQTTWSKSQKTAIFILDAVRTSNPIFLLVATSSFIFFTLRI
jgi:hypothetical protein